MGGNGRGKLKTTKEKESMNGELKRRMRRRGNHSRKKKKMIRNGRKDEVRREGGNSLAGRRMRDMNGK